MGVCDRLKIEGLGSDFLVSAGPGDRDGDRTGTRMQS